MKTLTNLIDVINRVAGLINVAVYLLVSVAVVFIVYNVVRYLIAGGDPAGKAKHLGNVGWGILGLAIIVSLWGLVNLIVSSFRTDTNSLPNIPNADFVNTRSGTSQPVNDTPLLQGSDTGGYYKVNPGH